MLTNRKLSNLQTILLILRHLAAESVSYFKKFLGFGLPQMIRYTLIITLYTRYISIHNACIIQKYY